MCLVYCHLSSIRLDDELFFIQNSHYINSSKFNDESNGDTKNVR